MACTITGEQRDAIYEELLTDLSGLGDIALLLDRNDSQAARAHGRRFIDDLRLLDDLGWGRDVSDACDEFRLTMAPEELARVLRRLSDNAAAVLYRHVVVPIDQREQTHRALTALAAYSDLLAQITTELPADTVGGTAAAQRRTR